MKKVISLFISLILVLGCFSGCGNDATTSASDDATPSASTTPTESKAPADPISTEPDGIAGVFSVGYGKANITPDTSVPLAGFGDNQERYSNQVMDPIYATCVAFTDEEGTTVLMLGLDLLNTDEDRANEARALITEATGVPADYIQFSATHTHSSVDLGNVGGSQQAAAEKFRQGCLEAAKQAMADRKPAQMYATFSRPDDLNYRRYYILEDGTYQAYKVGLLPASAVHGHLGKADNLLQLVKFTREGGKDVILVNWQAHYCGANSINYNGISADYPGVLRNELEQQLNCHAAFVLGGAGNLVCNTKVANTHIVSEYTAESYITHGKLLAAEAVKAAEHFQPARTGNIHLTADNFVFNVRKHPVYTFGFGEFACAFAPFEIFDMHARAVRESSPYKYTFYASCANAGNGMRYLPYAEAFDFYSYETSNTLYGKGAGEALRDQLSEMMAKTFTASGQSQQEKAEGYLEAPFEPFTNGYTYLNPAPGSLTVTKGMNGYWYMDLLYNGKPARILTRDEALARTIAGMDSVQLLFDDYNVAVGIVE